MLRKLAVACGATAVVVGSLAPAVADAVPTVPSPPVGVVAYSWDNISLDVAWLPSEYDGGSLILWYVATVSPGGETCRTQALTNLMRCSFALPAGQAYTVTVTAENNVGVSRPSNPSEPAMVWALPQVKSVKPGNRKVRVRWNAAIDDSVTGFSVSEIGGKRTCYVPAEKRACVVWGLKNGRKYRFQVFVRIGRNVIVTSKPSRVAIPQRATKRGGDL